MNKDYIKTLINKDRPLILDIGSYNGRDSKEFFYLFNQKAEIYAFEADPRAQILWEKNVTENIVLTKAAIGDYNGMATFNIADKTKDDFHCSGSLAKPKTHLSYFPCVNFDGTVEVQCLTLDYWVKENIPDKIIDLVWMDVNGAEKQAIQGGINTFTDRVRLLVTEFSNDELYENQITKSQLLDLLPDYVVIDEMYYEHGFGDILLRNSKLD